MKKPNFDDWLFLLGGLTAIAEALMIAGVIYLILHWCTVC